jgi:hypothetical protein
MGGQEKGLENPWNRKKIRQKSQAGRGPEGRWEMIMAGNQFQYSIRAMFNPS